MRFRTRVDLYNIEETFTRPVLVSLLKDIKNLLGINPDTYTVFDVKDALIKEKNAMGELEGFNTIKSEMVIVNYEENMMDNEELCLDSMFDNDMSIFRDHDIKCYMRPIFHNRKFNLNIRYKTKFKNRAFGLLGRLKMMPANGELYTYHNIEYSYILPVHVNRWLKMIYTLKTKRPQDKVDLETYLASMFDHRLEYFNRADGSNKSRLAIRESQLRIPGMITTDMFNIKNDYDEDKKEWVIEFDYEVFLEKPVSLIVEYPIMIYNTLIPKEYRNFIRIYKNRPNAAYVARHDDKSVQRTRDMWQINDDREYLCIPKEDQPDIPPNNKYNYLLSVLCSVDDNDEYKLFNIRELGPKAQFTSKALYIMLSEYKYIYKEDKTLFFMKLYVDGKPKFEALRMDPYGNISTVEKLDYHKTYRVVVGFNAKFWALLKPDKKRLNQLIQEANRLEKEGGDMWLEKLFPKGENVLYPGSNDGTGGKLPPGWIMEPTGPYDPKDPSTWPPGWVDGPYGPYDPNDLTDPKNPNSPNYYGKQENNNTGEYKPGSGNRVEIGDDILDVDPDDPNPLDKIKDKYSIFDFSKVNWCRMFTLNFFTVRTYDGNQAEVEHEKLKRK